MNALLISVICLVMYCTYNAFFTKVINVEGKQPYIDFKVAYYGSSGMDARIKNYVGNLPLLTTIQGNMTHSPHHNDHDDFATMVPSNTSQLGHGDEIKQSSSSSSSGFTDKKDSYSIPSKTVEFDFGDGGFANNIYGLVTCYIVAALTNATLIFNPRYPHQNMFTVTDLHGVPAQIVPFPRHIQRKRMKMPNICFTKKSKVVQKLMVSPITDVFHHDHIILATNCPLFAWMLYYNETYNDVIRLGLLEDKPFNSSKPSIHGFRLLSNIVKNHFIMNDDIKQAVQERRKVMGNSSYVAFHIRMGDRKSDFRETRAFIFTGDIHAFSNCKLFRDFPNSSIFVASDSSYAKSIVVQDNTSRRVVTFPEKAEHSYSAVRSGKGHAVIQKLLVDIMTIASCDAIIGTYKSSFSILAAAFQGNPPYLVTRNSQCFPPNNIVF